MTTYTAIVTTTGTDTATIKVVHGDLISASFTARNIDNLGYIEETAGKRDGVFAIYDRATETITCDDEQLQRALQTRAERFKTLDRGCATTFTI